MLSLYQDHFNHLSEYLTLEELENLSSLSRRLKVLCRNTTTLVVPEDRTKVPPGYSKVSTLIHLGRIITLPLPESITHLDLKQNRNLRDEDIQHLPRGLLRLSLGNNEILTDVCVPHLPRGSLHLDLYGNRKNNG